MLSTPKKFLREAKYFAKSSGHVDVCDLRSLSVTMGLFTLILRAVGVAPRRHFMIAVVMRCRGG